MKLLEPLSIDEIITSSLLEDEILEIIIKNKNNHYDFSDFAIVPKNLDMIVKSITDEIIDKFKILISIHSSLSFKDFYLNILSDCDKKYFDHSEIRIFFQTKTVNSIMNEVVENEEEYDIKILKFLEKNGLGPSGKGYSTAEILKVLGGNSAVLRHRLLLLKEDKKIEGIGRTRNKTWVIFSLKDKAIAKFNKELGRN